MSAVINPSDIIWGVAQLFATRSFFDDVPFGELSNFSLKDTLGLKELPGTSRLTAIAVGVGDRKITGEAEWAKIRLSQYLQLRGGTRTLLAAIAAPVSGPTLTRGAGSTSFTTGYIAVAYSYVNRYGETLISPITTVNLTSAGDKVAVTAVTPLGTGVTAINWYVGTAIYASAPLAAAGALAFHSQNAGVAFDIIAFPATGNRGIPTSSSLSTARSVHIAKGTDEPTVFNMHCKNPSDGTASEMYVYGCIAPDLDVAVKLRDFVLPKFTFNVYGSDVLGDGSTVIYETVLPGDQTITPFN